MGSSWRRNGGIWLHGQPPREGLPAPSHRFREAFICFASPSAEACLYLQYWTLAPSSPSPAAFGYLARLSLLKNLFTGVFLIYFSPLRQLMFPSLCFPHPCSQWQCPWSWQGRMNSSLQQLQSALSFWENKPGQGLHEPLSSECNSLTGFVLLIWIFKAIEPLLGA